MVQDRQHEQALQATADSLIAEQHALQKRLQQLTTEFESNVEVVQQLQAGEWWHFLQRQLQQVHTELAQAYAAETRAVYPCPSCSGRKAYHATLQGQLTDGDHVVSAICRGGCHTL
jgi:uncharacterized membrane protein YheB (UPF0754 family)